MGLRIKFKTINAQLSFNYSMLIAVVISSIVIFVAVLISNEFIEQKKEIMRSTLETVAGSIESRVNSLRRLTQALRSDGSIEKALEAGAISPQAKSSMNGIYTYGLQSIVLIDTDNTVLNPQSGANVEQVLNSTDYYRFLESNREEMFSSPHSFPFEVRANDPNYNTRMSYYFTLREGSRFQKYGYMQVNINRDSLFMDRVKLVNAQFDEFYVINNLGNIVYSSTNYDTSSEVASYAIKFARNKYSVDNATYGNNVYFHYPMPSYPDWHIMGVASIGSIAASSDLFITYIVLTGVVSIILVICISMLISRRITVPIKQLGSSMRIFESGSIPEKVEVTASGEVEMLVHGFNAMLDNIKTNIDAIYREQEEKKRAEIVALEYQLQSLQRQINPHFLYNTLNVIPYLAMEGKYDDIRHFVLSLNQLLRSTLSNTQEEVMASQEISFLKAYIHIMEYRYYGVFEVDFDIDESALVCMMPKLILQPLVENSLLHGILPSGGSGSIRVALHIAGGELVVSVSDNGVGFDTGNMDALLEQPKGFNSIGLKNVNDRLILCYGANAALEFASENGKGTTVSFHIPVKYEE